MSNKLLYGVGINDADYVVNRGVYLEERHLNGKKKWISTWKCPYYTKWKSMIERCYSEKHQITNPAYKDVTVCEEWLTFSNFRKWMVSQPWQVKEGESSLHLDKDILLKGNKVYSPEACVFVSRLVNNFINTNRGKNKSKYLLSCYWRENSNKFTSNCNSYFDNKVIHLGYFNTELESHLAWKKQKHIYSCALADSEYVTDERVAEALRNKYKNYTIYEEEL